ncbi:MAG: hypothetical protein JWO19_2286 [Bryobacterales bacterium]|nr:hypothetical protein [Bryobacterales bacterium]
MPYVHGRNPADVKTDRLLRKIFGLQPKPTMAKVAMPKPVKIPQPANQITVKFPDSRQETSR